MKICNNCHKELPDDSRFCQYCGSKDILTKENDELEDDNIIKCLNCGKQLPSDSKFCQYCGSENISIEKQKDTIYKYCVDCGSELQDKAEYCHKCGSKKIAVIYNYRIDEIGKRKSKRSFKNWKNLAIVFFAAIVVSLLIVFGIKTRTNTIQNINTRVLSSTISTNQATIKVEIIAPSDENVYLFFKCNTNSDYKKILVNHGTTYTTQLKPGAYVLKVAIGNEWINNKEMFGDKTKCYATKEPLYIKQNRKIDISVLMKNGKEIEINELY